MEMNQEFNKQESKERRTIFNNSGQGKAADVPKEVRGWSFGGFALSWIWGLGNNTYIALLALIPIVNLVMFIILGIHGREYAWQNKRWESVEEFNSVQHKWDIAGIVILALTFICMFL